VCADPALEPNPPCKDEPDRFLLMAALIQDKLTHLAKNWHHINSFPAAVAKDAVAKLMPGG
jgi:hypothetical protein